MGEGAVGARRFGELEIARGKELDVVEPGAMLHFQMLL